MSELRVKVNSREMDGLQSSLGNMDRIISKRGNSSLESLNREKKTAIESNPWTVGGMAGGVPVDTGRLRRDHVYSTPRDQSVVEVRSDYAHFVHEGTQHMEARPWLNYAVDEMESHLDRELDNLLDNIVNDLAN